jgi:hypothetical protein
MTLQEYDRILEEAFSFLKSGFGYSSEPSKSGGGRFGSGFHKRFSRQNLSITLLIGDADSQIFCHVFFSDGDDAKLEPSRRRFRQRTLGLLLSRKSLSFDDPCLEDLASDSAKVEALFAYGNLVKDYALDVVQGDFSVFPQLVYVVHHVDRKYPTGEVRRLIGVYSSYHGAEKAVSKRITKPGFVVRQDGFEVDCVELDFGAHMTGIEIYPSDQATDLFMRGLKAASLSEFSGEEQRELESRWLSRFSAFQEQFEVSLLKGCAKSERSSIAVQYPPDHIAWTTTVDEQKLRGLRSELVYQLRSQSIAMECWRNARDYGELSPRFVAFVEEELKDRL